MQLVQLPVNINFKQCKDMEKDHYIGVDISKRTIDIAIYVKSQAKKGTFPHETFSNTEEGFKDMKKWLRKQHVVLSKSLFCMEATGNYTYELCLFLEQLGVAYSIQSPLHLKRSFGLTHGKNDKVDASRIAYYAYLHREDIKLSKLASDSVRKLKALIVERKSLVVEIARCKAQLKEVGEHAPGTGTVKRTEALQEFLESQVESIEEEMAQTIESDEQMKTNYNLLLSVDGIGIVNAINTIIATHNFEMFDNARQYASYIGVAPFEHTSGTSVRGKTHVEPGAKMLKADLTGAVRTCINHDKEIRKYYDRKMAEGKAFGIVANAIKFKLLLRMFAVIKRGTPFVRKPDFIYQ